MYQSPVVALVVVVVTWGPSVGLPRLFKRSQVGVRLDVTTPLCRQRLQAAKVSTCAMCCVTDELCEGFAYSESIGQCLFYLEEEMTSYDVIEDDDYSMFRNVN